MTNLGNGSHEQLLHVGGGEQSSKKTTPQIINTVNKTHKQQRMAAIHVALKRSPQKTTVSGDRSRQRRKTRRINPLHIYNDDKYEYNHTG